MCTDMSPLEKAIQFHGHICPGLLTGVRAAELAMEILGIGPDRDEEIIAIVENDSCSVDAIQAILSCTMGKGNLIFRDYGKQVFTIASREQKRAIRIALRADALSAPEFRRYRELQAVMDKGEAQAEELDEVRASIFEKMMTMSVDELFDYREVAIDWPEKATIYDSVPCARCGEKVSSHRAVNTPNGMVCIPCSEEENCRV